MATAAQLQIMGEELFEEQIVLDKLKTELEEREVKFQAKKDQHARLLDETYCEAV